MKSFDIDHAGRYSWKVTVKDESVEETAFEVLDSELRDLYRAIGARVNLCTCDHCTERRAKREGKT